MSNAKPLGDIVDINPRMPPALLESPSRMVDFVPMASLSEGGYVETHDARPLEEVSKGYTYFENGDVIVAKITPCMENGKAALVRGLPHGIAFGSTEFHVLRSRPENPVDGRYLFYMIWNPRFRYEAERNMTGTAGQKRVPTNFLKRFEIPLPKLPEQQRIADILDKADAIRRKRLDVSAAYVQLREAAFTHLFGDPVTNPFNYPSGIINDLVSDVTYGTSSKAGAVGRYPILRMNNLTATGDWDFSSLKYIDLPDREVDRYSVRRGDILFNRTNSKELVGKTAVFNEDTPMVYAGYLIRVRTNECAAPSYVAGYLNSPHGKAVLRHMCKSIIGMANINATELRGIGILIPPKAKQLEYEHFVDKTRRAESVAIQAATEAGDLFNSLVQRAFRGEL